jgi:hypothetical protein
VASKIIKSKQGPKPSQVFGKNGVFFTFPEGEHGPMQIKIDFARAPRPLNYFYADSFHLELDTDLQMTLLSFGRRDAKRNTFADRIEVVMPAKSLLGQFWASSREVESSLDKILESLSQVAKIRPIVPVSPSPDLPAPSLFANVVFVVAGDGETTLDFYHLSPREVHLAKTQKQEMLLQPTIRVIMSSVLTKYFFDSLRPYVEGRLPNTNRLEEDKLATR